MSWQASLALQYTREQGRSVARWQHRGPLRVLQSLYPEGPEVCHNVLVHPPGGLVGGDTLEIQLQLAENAHALLSTPSATRFYKSTGPQAVQRIQARLGQGARLEWLPLETLAYPGCHALNQLQMELAPEAEAMGWDLTALGLPASQQPFSHGRLTQHLEIPGIWLERATLDGTDKRLLDSPLGLAGHRAMATLFFASGQALHPERREAGLQAVRDVMDAYHPHVAAGATAVHPQVLVVRVLTPLLEPAMNLLQACWKTWRHTLWNMDSPAPRIWRV
jgi:urease accessory protein